MSGNLAEESGSIDCQQLEMVVPACSYEHVLSFASGQMVRWYEQAWGDKSIMYHRLQIELVPVTDPVERKHRFTLPESLASAGYLIDQGLLVELAKNKDRTGFLYFPIIPLWVVELDWSRNRSGGLSFFLKFQKEARIEPQFQFVVRGRLLPALTG